MKIKEIINPVLNYRAILLNGVSLEKATEFANKKLQCKFISPANTIAAVLCVEGYINHIIWFKNKRPDAGVIAHEAFHSVYHIFQERCASLTKQNEELYAYTLQWTIDEIRKRL